eukprot:954208-Karenia_brevis.AAC.1
MLRLILGSGRRKLPVTQPAAEATTTTALDDTDSETSQNSSETSSTSSQRDTDTTHDATDDNLESYVDWIRRTTHHIEEKVSNLGLEDWTTTIRRRQWKWASKLDAEDAHRDDPKKDGQPTWNNSYKPGE